MGVLLYEDLIKSLQCELERLVVAIWFWYIAYSYHHQGIMTRRAHCAYYKDDGDSKCYDDSAVMENI